MFRIECSDVAVLGHGVRVLGSGGGGDPDVACSVLARSLARSGTSVDVVAPDELPPDAVVVPFGFIGATSLLAERPPSGHEVRTACLTAHPAPAAVVPMEIGGFNGVAAAWAAALLGVPLVDADLMGRALPGLHQLLPVVDGWNPCPAVVVDVHGRVRRLAETPPAMLEAIARAALTPMGGWAVLGCQPLSAADAGAYCHQRTVSRALAYGRELLADGGPGSGTVLGTGRVVEVTRGRPRPGRRSPATTVVVELASGVLRLEAESEWLAVVVDGEPKVTVPDLLVVWDVDSQEVLTVDTIRYGRNVMVTALPGEPGWWRPDALPLVEPAAFALDIPPCRVGPALAAGDSPEPLGHVLRDDRRRRDLRGPSRGRGRLGA